MAAEELGPEGSVYVPAALPPDQACEPRMGLEKARGA